MGLEYVVIFILLCCMSVQNKESKIIFVAFCFHALFKYLLLHFFIVDFHLMLHLQSVTDLALFFVITFLWKDIYGVFYKSAFFTYIVMLGLLTHFPMTNELGVFILSYGYIVLYEGIILFCTWKVPKNVRNNMILVLIFCVWVSNWWLNKL